MKLFRKLLLASVVAAHGVSAGYAESLREAVRFAVTTNPTIKASEAEMRGATFELLQLKREYEPTITLDGEVGWQRIDDPENLSPDDNDEGKHRNRIGLRAELILFDGYRRSNLVYANAARVDGSIFRLLDASETLALNATEAYIDVHRHRVLTDVARRNVEKHEEIGQRVRELVRGGRLPFSDELTIDDRIRSAKLTELTVRRALQDAEARYERVIGRAPTGGMSVPRAQAPRSLASLKKEAVQNSYRVQFARTQIDQSRFQAQAILSDRLPRITLNAGISRDENRNGVSGDRDDESFGLGMSWILYQGGRKEERRALAEQTSRAMAEQSIAVREVTELAARTWTAYTINLERSQQLEEQLSINRLLVEVYQEEFEAAKRSLLDLLEIERARFNVEFETVGARSGLAFSTYRTLATRSKLADHFGLAKSDLAFDADFQERAQVAPTNVFKTTLEPLAAEPASLEPLQ